MNNKPSQEPARTLFSYHASHGTTEGETYAYLLRNSLFDSKRGQALANQAIVAWWLAYARKAAHHQQSRETAIDCIEQLEQHIAKLRRDFQIPPLTLSYQGIPVPPVPAVSQPSSMIGCQESPPITAHKASEAGLPDDSLYGQFNMEE